ncbi:MAG: hypothetical protein AAB885_03920 [Patescibacteria group bacterium]
MFLNTLKFFLAVVFAALMSGCALIGAGIGAAISEGESGKLSGTVEVGEVKMKAGANVTLPKTAKLSSAVFEKDMVTLNTSSKPTDAKINAAVADEVKRSLGTPGNAVSPVTVRLKTLYTDSYPIDWYYRSITEKKTLGLFQSSGIRKLVNIHFVLEQGSDTLLEVHGLWVSGHQGDEILGARKLAREMVSEVLKKLSTPAASVKKE